MRHLLEERDALTLFKSNVQPYFDQGEIYYDVSTQETAYSASKTEG